MAGNEPVTELIPDTATKVSQRPDGRSAALEGAELFWVTTVRPTDDRTSPRYWLLCWTTPYFCTGPEEQKVKNIAGNPHCILMTVQRALTKAWTSSWKATR
jgi:hypothetical protein